LHVKTIHFCTFFDSHYLSRGIALLESLNKHCPHFTLYILCLDDITYTTLASLNLSNAALLELTTLEKDDSRLLTCKKNRSLIEYYFTLSPCLPLYILEKIRPDIDYICSLDADICFFDNPSVIFADFADFSILITEHNLNEELNNEDTEKYGKYNVSFQAFRNDEIGITCLKRWRKQCIEWCYDYIDEKNHRFADQLYLEEWTTLYPNKVKVITPNTEGVAPWNLNKCHLTLKDGKLYSNGQSLIYYHFHGLNIIDSKWVANRLSIYKTKITEIIKYHLYLPYILKIKLISKSLENQSNNGKSIRYTFSSMPKFVKLLKYRSVFYLHNDQSITVFNFLPLVTALRKVYYAIVKFK
jgi:hypothetical protein